MEEKRQSGFGTASLILGIIGICTSFIPIVNNISFILGLIGLVFGIVSVVKKASKGMAIAGVIISILTLIIVYNSQKTLSEGLETFSNELDNISGNRTDDILGKDVEVILGDFEVIKDNYITDTKLNVNVTNKTSETKSFSIQIEAVDNTGTRITQDTVYANNLTAGQSQNLDAFNLITSDKVETLKNATFKILQVSMY